MFCPAAAFQRYQIFIKGTVIQVITGMITTTEITNTEIFAFIAVLVFKLLSRKVLFINRKTLETVKEEYTGKLF